MSIEIEVTVDKKDVVYKLNLFATEMQKGFYFAFVRIADRLKGEQISMTPVDTGKLKRSIEEKAHAWGVNGIASARSPAGYDYAKINHDGGIGTGFYAPHAIPARKYMSIPLFASVPYVLEALDQEVTKKIAICGL